MPLPFLLFRMQSLVDPIKHLNSSDLQPFSATKQQNKANKTKNSILKHLMVHKLKTPRHYKIAILHDTAQVLH